MTGIWKMSKNGEQFQAALEENGWILARGDRRSFVAIDRHGGVHSIARRVEGAKAADVRQRFLKHIDFGAPVSPDFRKYT